ncbi:filamentous hemagglutinin N-terminal domain-containing protein [Calothrix sp. CCY 0018]|uniref:two-partner secretion domain-containing protein n=1 Tax=Calothrix sp. CCY 0018 TaxID=3103864 RepID=UPI0039C63CFB
MFLSSLKKAFHSPCCLGILAISFLQASAYAQVIKDDTLPTRVTTTDNLNFTIDSFNNKNRIGNNLFHSFKEFSIPTGGSAVFNNSTDVVNIINRVTGGNLSNIDGLIKANGNANLFLINPNGIVFGKNARLDIGGSFFGSTAESIKFADDIEFSAINTITPPLLSINLPLGLQMGSNSAAIEVQGDGYTAVSNDRDLFSPFVVTNINGLRVKPENTLALVGGEVFLNGGIVAADSGRVELASVNSGLVKINSNSQSWSLNYKKDDIQSFGDIKFSSQALADASGIRSGSIQLQARNIYIKNGSKVFVQSRGLQSGGKLNIDATESIEVIGTSSDDNFTSAFLTNTLEKGDAAEISISTPHLLMSDGGVISSETFNSGKGGNITINAFESLQIKKSSPTNPIHFGDILTYSFAGGKAGDINIYAKDLSIASQYIASPSYATGNSGNISISVKNLTNLDGGVIASTTLGIGSGGDVTVNSESIKLKGFDFDRFTPSGLSASTLGIGNAGNLTVNTGSLILEDGGRVDSSTLAFGKSGSVTIKATDFIEVSGTVANSVNPSLIVSSANIVDESLQQLFGLAAIPSGDSGNVDINTPILKVNNGGEVTVKNDGTGKGGILNINANSILLNSKGKITASTQSGTGGNIDLQVKNGLILRNKSLISTESLGTGNGGNININSSVIAGVENSDIIANAVEGNGGNINIHTSGLFGLELRDKLTTESDITASSQFGVSGTVEINNPAINPNSSFTELPINVIDSTQTMKSGCSANRGNNFAIVGKGGLPYNAETVIRRMNLWQDLRSLNAVDTNKKTSIQVKKNSPKAIFEATGLVVDQEGNIEFVAQSNDVNAGDNWHKTSNCKGEVENI